MNRYMLEVDCEEIGHGDGGLECMTEIGLDVNESSDSLS